jgi:hypothetical protein
MAYKKAENNSFAEYQMGEGFGSAVTGKNGSMTTGDLKQKITAKMAKSAITVQNIAKGVKGYEGYPSSYEGYGYGSMEAGDLNSGQAAKRLMRNAEALPGGLGGLSTEQSAESILSAARAQGYHGYSGGDLDTEQSAKSILSTARAQGYQGYETYSGGNLDTEQSARSIINAAKAQGYEGMSGVEDDAFAGYQNGLGQILSMKQAAEIAKKDRISDDVLEFSGLGESDNLESWHTFFHKATLATTDTGMLSALKKAVKAVPDDTPASVKRSYYDTAKKMMSLRKNTDLRYLDINRMEIESNLGWLIDPRVPKTGGFDAMLNKVVGAVGARLGKGDKDDLKMRKNEELGNKLREQLAKTGMNLGDWSDVLSSKFVYVGLGVLGLGAAYCYFKRQKPVFAKKKKKK